MGIDELDKVPFGLYKEKVTLSLLMFLHRIPSEIDLDTLESPIFNKTSSAFPDYIKTFGEASLKEIIKDKLYQTSLEINNYFTLKAVTVNPHFDTKNLSAKKRNPKAGRTWLKKMHEADLMNQGNLIKTCFKEPRSHKLSIL